MRKPESGVTLLELVVVIVIVGILAAIAVPSYRQFVIRSQRVDATSGLLRLATAQEKFYLQNNTYATNAQRAVAPPNGLGIAGTENGWYTLTITAASAAGFTATAVPVAGGPQAADACQLFQVDDRGVKTATSPDCWD